MININKSKNEGEEKLQKLVDMTMESKEIFSQVNSVIGDTKKSSDEISKASERIRSISSQTNLLALNASIEAARAGEAGKGFAVVAEEIGKLAVESANFSGQINTIIKELNTESENAVEMMDKSMDMVNEQGVMVNETSKAFNVIAEALETSETIVENIINSVENMQTTTAKITNVVENLSAIAEENAATTEEASAAVDLQTISINDISDATEHLSEIATALQKLISSFSIEETQLK